MARRKRNNNERDNNQIVVDYESASAICAAATADYGNHNKAGIDYWNNRTGDCEMEWMGLNGFARDGETSLAATVRAVREGFPKGAELIHSLGQTIEPPVTQSIRRRCVWADFGDEVSMDRVYSGNLDTAWRRPVKRMSVGPSKVRIVVDSIASGGMDSERMAWRGVAASKLADSLTEAGYAVEVVSAFDGPGQAGLFRVSCVVKSFETPMDIQTLAATTALPAFFRAIGHIMQPIHANDGEAGDGCCYRVQDLDATRFNEDGVTMFVAGQELQDMDSASKWVNECIAFIDNQYALAA